MLGWIDVILLVLLVLLNGVFAMSEIALITSRRARLQQLKENNTSGAQRAIELNEDPTKALSTIQVGITLIGIVLGIVGESALAGPVSELFVWLGMRPETAGAVSLVLVVILVTYFSIVVGELVPKPVGSRTHRLPCGFSDLHSFCDCRALCALIKLFNVPSLALIRSSWR